MFGLTLQKFRALCWALYDFANTIFSAIVVTVYLPLHITELSGVHTTLGLSATSSMILSALFIPFLGAITDRTGKTKGYLFRTTFLCAIFTALLSSTKAVPPLLLFFVAANFLFHCSLVFYNSLLPAVAPPEKQGLVSGIGTGLGYLGVVFSLPFAHQIDWNYGRDFVFITAAVGLALFAVPLFLFVPERRVAQPEKLTLREVRPEIQKLVQTIRELPQRRDTFYFLIANLLVLDALNAIILWLSVYMSKELHIPQVNLVKTFLALNFSAFWFGILMGKVTDLLGSRKTFFISCVSLFAAVLIAGTTRSIPLFTVGILIPGAMAAAGIWTAGRKLLIELSPPNEVGKFFGLYGFTTKISAVGSSTFSILADLFTYRAAVLSQLVTIALALLFLALMNKKGSDPFFQKGV